MFKRVFIFSILFLLCNSKISFSQSYYDFEIEAINFEGNNFFSASDLLKNIESKETPMWVWVFLDSFTPFGDEPVYFDSSKISIDILALKELYRTNGFFNINVKHDVVIDSADKAIVINYYITENEFLNYGNISLFGLDRLSDYDYGRLMNESYTIDSTKRFSESEVQGNISKIRRFLANNGYIFGGYDSTIVTIDTIRQKTDLSIYFHTGDKYAIGETIINKSGLSIEQINNKLISEIADLKPGRIYDQSEIDRSELRLLKTELFTAINIDPIISDTINNTIPVEVNAAIGSLNELSPEIKADNEFNSFNFGLGIGYTRKNFFGDARKLSLSTSFRLVDILNIDLANIFKSGAERDSTYQGVFDINLKMEQPFLFGRAILTSTEIYLSSKTFSDYSENSYGGRQKFDFEMPPYTFITLFRPFISYDVAERENIARINLNGIQLDLTETDYSLTPGIGVELGSSKTDDILFPTTGSYLFFTPELFHSRTDIQYVLRLITDQILQADSNEVGNIYFYRLQTGLSNYLPLSDDRTTVFASKLRIGYSQPITGSDNPKVSANELIPPNKTFYAGGSNSVRGWKSRELIPKDSVEYYGYTTETDAIRGGTFWFEGSFEMRQKLNEYLGYAVFADYGNTWNGWKNVRIDEIAVAVGLGIRVYTPIAPFRLDFGTKFYNPEDQKTIFRKNFLDNLTIHFGIGEAF
ncbi:MAG: BamA/TamA family outer membrane protein [Ignavibacteriales bacterium]|nr:BamA/TamA family outer membrane protein [Ignavibacteriales bacterium]